MDAADWERAKEIFEALLEMNPAERAAFLDRACDGVPELRKEVESMLDVYDQADSFFETPAVEDALKIVQDRQQQDASGRRIGSYRVISEIGRGGMGTVYLATRADDEYKKQVAIKLVRSGASDKSITNRFLAERQILANLDHPNIARLLDGGTTDDGLPYLVMEYIEGLPIDQYCDQHKLSTAARLELFRTVLGAVQYAHNNLVIHRDIKPGNIMVTDEGVPKLLDFGIAKILAEGDDSAITGQTQTGLRLMTPDYASPEQVKGLAMTTATDIYSLGVVLYRLLTGHQPYRFKVSLPQEIERVICEQEPERPSIAVNRVEAITTSEHETVLITPEGVGEARNIQPDRLRRLLGGDLDNIILMAMRKEPQRRYASAEQLSEDIRRYLEGLPVLAHKDSLGYRASKFVRRHKFGVAAAALIALTLLAGIIVTTREARIAKIQSDRAEKRFNDVRKLANSFMFEIHDSVKNLAGSTPTRKLLVTRALEYLDSLATESADDPSLRRELATAYEKVGDIQGNPYSANLGDIDGALASYRKAVAIRESLKGGGSQLELQKELGVSYRSLGDILDQKGDLTDSIANYRKSLSIFEKLSASFPDDEGAQDELARAYETLGDGLGRNGNLTEAMPLYKQAMAIRESLSAKFPANNRYKRGLAILLMKSGDQWKTEPAEAVASLRKSVSILQSLAQADPLNASAQRDASMALNRLCEVSGNIGDYRTAVEVGRQSLEIRKGLAERDPENIQARFDLAAVEANLAEALARSGDPRGGVELSNESVSLMSDLVQKDPANMMLVRNLGLATSTLALANSLGAKSPGPSTEARRAFLRAAIAAYTRAREIFLDLQRQGALRSEDQNMAGDLAKDIKDCESEQSKLGRTSHPEG